MSVKTIYKLQIKRRRWGSDRYVQTLYGTAGRAAALISANGSNVVSVERTSVGYFEDAAEEFGLSK